MSAHTPGPWTQYESDPLIIINSDGVSLGEMSAGSPNVSRSEQIANARLIAAAPELLAVVQELADCAAYWSEYDVPLGVVDRINAALAKATGKQP